MNLSNDVFERYFDNKISQKKLLHEIGGDNPKFEKKLEEELEGTLIKKDGKRLEYLIYAMLLMENNINIHRYIDILNELLICNWHEQHENIVMFLQKIRSPLSVKYLKCAIYLKPQYLSWDDNYAFEVKCIWTLGYIKNLEAQTVLEHIALDANEILSQNAKKQLSRM